jgi:radical SAM superfamily enzyme
MNSPFGSIHYNAIGPYLKKHFGCRIAKPSVDGGFTCPNRDGGQRGSEDASTVQPAEADTLQVIWPIR